MLRESNSDTDVIRTPDSIYSSNHLRLVSWVTP